MNAKDRDELLIRIDERVQAIREEDIPRIENVQKSQDTRIRKNEVSAARHKAILGIFGAGGGGTAVWALVQKFFNGG